MAGNSVIGALRVVLGIDSASLETGLKKAQSSLKSFSANSAAAGVAIAAAFVAVGASIKSAIDEAAKMSRLAESVGVPIEELTALKFAAQLSGIEIETLAKSMGILSKNMVTAAAGADQMDVKGGKAAQAFKALKIDVLGAGGQLKTSTEIMTEVAGKFEGMQDGAGKTALAMMIFGKSGAALIPMLNKGSDGLKEMMAEAEKLGLVLDKGTGQAAVQFNNTLQRMQKIKEGMWQVIAEKLLPAFQTFANIMLEGRQNSNLMSAAADLIVTSLRGVVSAAILGVTAIGNIGRALSALKTFAADFLAMNVFDPEAWAAASKKFTDVMDDNAKRMAAAGEVVKRVWQDVNTQFQNSPGALAPLTAATEKAKNALQSFLDTQAKSLAAQQAEVQTFGLAAGAKERLKIQLQALAIAQANAGISMDLYRGKVDAAALAAGNMAMKLAGLQLTEENLLPWERYNQILARNAELLAANPALAETVARANRKAADETGMSWKMASESIAGSFTELAGAVGDANSDIAKGAKIFAAAVAFINVLVAQSYALAGPFPANLVAMALVAAKGAVLIAAIRGAMVPTAAHGADWMVGGAPGMDNNLVSFRASRGERVRVDPPGQSMGGEARQNIVNLTLKGIGASREELREMIGQLNGMFGDGYKLQIAGAR